MTIRAVTFDFWGTLFRDRDSDLRQNLRIERLAHDAGVSQEAARALLDDAIREFARCHIEEQRTLDSRDAVRMAEKAFGTAFAPEKAAALAHYFSTVILAYPPAPIEDALEAVRSAAARVPVGLISDTGISPGDSLRVVLNRYGFSESANVRAENIHAADGTMSFDVVRVNGTTSRIPVVLNLPGRHNVLNALAAIAVATEVGVSDEAIIKALAEFKGVGRRFQRYGEVSLPQGGAVTVIDDYGHHPVEMAATIAAARGAFPSKRLVLAFQPHRYTRTRDCFEDFVKVLSTEIGRKCRICDENWSIRYTFGYRHRLRDAPTMNSAFFSPNSAASSARRG